MTAPDPAHLTISADARFRVLARKYRPATFATLIGQDALVRTLTNAFRVGRIAHAYMLSGVRGVGKTTTARIIARALNCVGADGTGEITVNPCGVCEHCVSIAEDRHLDIIEMDAASHTGVDNIRELLDGVPYRPALARYKVYIIDEVHMLSEKAFNALLKTLEEPPEHVKFIFATTEIRKVPITVLSRCQRFDLRRVETAELIRHLARVVEQEEVTVAHGALQLLARAADGSVRDSLSLLDQAIAHGGDAVDEQTVREMLGLVDRALCFDMLDAVMQGDATTALSLLDDQYCAGADPLTILEDLLELTHWLTRIKLAPACLDAPDVPEAERVRGRDMAHRLGIADVTRTWQMLLKGLSETRIAPMPVHAVEMVLIRLAYAAQLPSPAEALDALMRGSEARTDSRGDTRAASGARSGGDGGSGAAPIPPASPAGSSADRSAPQPNARPQPPSARATMSPAAGGSVQPSPAEARAIAHSPPRQSPASTPPSSAPQSPTSFAEVVELAKQLGEGLLYGHLMTGVHLVRFEPGSIEMRLGEHAPADLPQRLSRFLLDATGVRWLVGVSHEAGDASLREQYRAQQEARTEEVRQHPLVRNILEMFPGATIGRILEGAPQQAQDTTDDTDEDEG
jgi:DNA polymerase III subunit gamma/tau